jgi:hypothetical protein
MVDYRRQGNTSVPQNTGGAAALQIRQPPTSNNPPADLAEKFGLLGGNPWVSDARGGDGAWPSPGKF